MGYKKDTPEILALIKKAQGGDSWAENKLVLIYSTYVDYMVSKYSKKTEIKDDDDLRAYIYLGLLDGIRKFDPSKNTKFIYFAHIWMKKNIFLGESKYRFIRVPVNQKVFYDKFVKKNSTDEDIISHELDHPDMQRFLTIENSYTGLFTDFNQYNEETGVYELPDKLLVHINEEEFKKDQEIQSIERLKENINSVLSEFNEKEIYIIERLFGLNGHERLSSEQIAKNLKVTKVNITFTKTRVIKILRHSSLSNRLLDGI